MKYVLVIIATLMAVPATSGLDKLEVCTRAAAQYYGFDKNEEAFRIFMSVALLENGRPGREMGHENPDQDDAAAFNPAMPCGCDNYAYAARAFVRFSFRQNRLNREWERKMFIKDFTEWYHAGGNGKTEDERVRSNKKYSSDVAKIRTRIMKGEMKNAE